MFFASITSPLTTWTPGYESYGEYSCEFQLQFIWFQIQEILEICPLPLRKTTLSIIVQYKVHELHSLLTVLMSVHNMTIAYCLYCLLIIVRSLGCRHYCKPTCTYTLEIPWIARMLHLSHCVALLLGLKCCMFSCC